MGSAWDRKFVNQSLQLVSVRELSEVFASTEPLVEQCRLSTPGVAAASLSP